MFGLVTAPGSLPATEFASWLRLWSANVALGALLFVVFLLPTGRLPSRRWRPVAGSAALYLLVVTLVLAFGSPGSKTQLELTNPFAIAWLREAWELVDRAFFLYILVLLLAVGSLLARFRSAVGAERQQLKWIVSGAVFMAAAFAARMSLIDAVGNVLFVAGITALPVSIGIAILRYRLYDIDLLINRTLVYGATSAGLLATYVLSVLALSTLLRPLTGSSDIAVAGSTLAVVALFGPLRQRIQRAVDRRFSRSRYDAERTVDAFTARLRDEVDRDALSRDLVAVVRDTVHPARAGVWLREAKR